MGSDDDDGGDGGDGESQPDDEQSGTPIEIPGPSTLEDDAFVQGQCSVVDIIINNQKPTEHQLGFDDFMDSDPGDDGDEDWDGDDDFNL